METSAANVLEIGTVLALAAMAGWMARRLGLPAILGYLAVGFAVSPFTPGYTANRDQLQTLADIGVVLLLFEVGIEIDPLRLRQKQGRLLWSAPTQVVVTVAAGLAAGLGMGLGVRGGLLLGLAVALSSSVVVINITRSRRRTTNAATESALLGWSVMQDVTGVAISMGLLAAVDTASRPLVLTAGGTVLFILITVAAAAVLPWLLRQLRTEPDLFLMLSVSSGLVLAGLGARVFDVPLALAAFVAGLAVGESPDADEARKRLAPFRDVFAVMFFVTIGTLVDPRTIPGSLAWLGIVLGLILVAKVGVIFALVRLAPIRHVRDWQLAIGLGQVGEFSFVLGAVGVSKHVIPTELYTALLTAVGVSVAISSLAVRVRPHAETMTWVDASAATRGWTPPRC